MFTSGEIQQSSLNTWLPCIQQADVPRPQTHVALRETEVISWKIPGRIPAPLRTQERGQSPVTLLLFLCEFSTTLAWKLKDLL